MMESNIKKSRLLAFSLILNLGLGLGLLWVTFQSYGNINHHRTRRQTIDEQAQENFFSSLASDHELYFQNDDDAMDTVQYQSKRVERQSSTDELENSNQNSQNRLSADDAVNILANQYNFANLATKREQQQIDERLRSLEYGIKVPPHKGEILLSGGDGDFGPKWESRMISIKK